MHAVTAVQEFVELLRVRVSRNDLSESTAAYYSSFLARFTLPIANRHLVDLSEEDWIKYWNSFLDINDLRPRSIRVYREVCCVFLDWCVDRGYMVTHGLRRVRTPNLDAASRPKISWVAFCAMLDAADRLGEGADAHEVSYNVVRSKALLWTAWSGLLRKSELWSLKLDNLRIDEDKPRVLVEKGKGRRARWQPLHPLAVKAIRRYLEVRGSVDSAWLWVNGGKQRIRMGKDAWTRLLRRLGSLAGEDLRQCKTHGTRRGSATWLLENGVDLAKVSKMLGHTHIATTEPYVEASFASIAEIYTRTDLPVPGAVAKTALSQEDLAAAILEIREWMVRQGPPPA